MFDCDFALRQGGFVLEFAVRADARAVTLFGPSGSGKTTALEAVAGLRTPVTGHVRIGERVLFDAGRVNLAPSARRVGYVPQDALLFPHLGVRQNVVFARPRRERFALAAIERMLELGPLMDRTVHGLSGGERQRVALGRALYSGPDLLLLDEPLAAVDRAARTRLVEALRRIRDELGVPMLYVTHARDEALALGEHAVVLDEGRVVAAGPPAEVI
jgi:molybdate transport system ATP-binding protein